MNAAGAMSSTFELNWRIWEKIATVIGCVLRANVSATSRSFQYPQELEDRERRNRREAERQDHPEEDSELRGTVDAGRLEQVAGNPDEEVPEEEDRERQAEGRVEKDESGIVSKSPSVLYSEKIGISAIWMGTTSRATTTTKSQSRPGNSSQANA